MFFCGLIYFTKRHGLKAENGSCAIHSKKRRIIKNQVNIV